MNRTMEILRNAVMVATASGISATAVTKIRMPTMLTLVSSMLEQPGDPHAETIADTHERAVADALAVGDDVQRLVEGTDERNERPRRQRGELLQRQLDPAQLEDHADRNGVESGILQPRGLCRIDVLFHAPLPGGFAAELQRRGQPATGGLD